MAVINRTLDPSEQRKSFSESYGALATGVTIPVLFVPFNSTLDAMQMAAFGISGSPTVTFAVHRFIVGTGFTTITAGFSAAAALGAFGTSGIVASPVAVAAGNTLLNLLAGDVVVASTGGANSAVTGLSVGLTIKAVQDLKTQYGI